MSNGKGLAYAGLILGLIGAGFGGYVFFDYTLAPIFGFREAPSDIDSWYVESYSITLPSTGVFLPLTGMVVSFDTTENVTLHILYTAYVRITVADGHSVDVGIYLNNVKITTNTYYIEEFGVALQERFAINMQNYIAQVAPGSYNVTIRAYVDALTTTFFENSLYVQVHT